MSANSANPLIGSQMGTYTIDRRIGRGGMGEVYLAHDSSLDRLAAIKVLPRLAEIDAVQRFQREARSVAKLSHPNIVQVYSFDVDADPPYMAMEYVEGKSLEVVLKEDGPLSWQRSLTICGQVAAALACAHGAGIIHRDIKPGNILIHSSGQVKVTDFGLAKVADSQTNLTMTNAAIGSPCYMSPEHWGQGDIVPASDIFSLGTTLFEMLSGRLPFPATTTMGLAKQITSEPPQPLEKLAPGVPEAVRAFVSGLMGKTLEARYATCVQIIADLNALSRQQPLQHLSALSGSASLPASTPPAAGEAKVPAKNLVDELMQENAIEIRKHVSITPDREFPWGLIAKAGVLLIVLILALSALAGFLRQRAKASENAGQPPVAVEPAGTQPQQGWPPPRREGGPRPGQPGFGGPGQALRPPPPGHPPPHRPPGGPPPQQQRR